LAAIIYDDGVVLDVSPALKAFMGAEGRVVGRSLFEFVAAPDRAGLRAAMKAAVEGAADHRRSAKFALLRARRAAAPAEVIFRPCGRRRLEATLRDRAAEFAAGREARAAAERRAARTGPERAAPTSPVPASAAMADISHEMKTPLSAIMGFADAMRAETFGPLGDAKYKEYAEFIHASGAHLMALIGAILDSAKLNAGQYAVQPARCAPGDIARECAAMIRGEAARAGLKLVVKVDRDLPEAMIDKRAVKQILINLLSNAVKFTGEGEIELSVKEKCGALDFIVRDTGVGMNKTVLAKLGGRFSDTHAQGVRGADGAGLGLSLAFKLARAHGGALYIDSELGEGTTARLALPFAPQDSMLANVQVAKPGDIQSQLDRVNAFRREHAARSNAA